MKFQIFFILATLSLIAIIPLGGNAFGYGSAPVQSSSNNFTVEFTSDKESYALGESVVFTGNVNKFDEDRSLRITIFDENQNLIVTKKTVVDPDTSFSHTFSLNEKFDDGKYIVKAQYGNKKSTIEIISFMINSENPISVNQESSSSEIPGWIKNNAGWWAEGAIDDRSFVEGIQFLIKGGLMKIPVTEQGEVAQDNQIPDWIKNNAGWWAAGQIDDRSFVEGIQFLIKQGLMKISN